MPEKFNCSQCKASVNCYYAQHVFNPVNHNNTLSVKGLRFALCPREDDIDSFNKVLLKLSMSSSRGHRANSSPFTDKVAQHADKLTAVWTTC